MVGNVVNPVFTVNPVTPIEIGLFERTWVLVSVLNNLPQLNRPNDVVTPAAPTPPANPAGPG